jgi:hypothetical protein
VLLHRGPIAARELALGVDGSALYVLYEDTARYPIALKAKRVEPSVIRRPHCAWGAQPGFGCEANARPVDPSDPSGILLSVTATVLHMDLA